MSLSIAAYKIFGTYALHMLLLLHYKSILISSEITSPCAALSVFEPNKPEHHFIPQKAKSLESRAYSLRILWPFSRIKRKIYLHPYLPWWTHTLVLSNNNIWQRIPASNQANRNGITSQNQISSNCWRKRIWRRSHTCFKRNGSPAWAYNSVFTTIKWKSRTFESNSRRTHQSNVLSSHYTQILLGQAFTTSKRKLEIDYIPSNYQPADIVTKRSVTPNITVFVISWVDGTMKHLTMWD